MFGIPSFASKRGENAVAVFDVGSGSVGVAVVVPGSDKEAARIFAGRRIQLAQEERDEKQRIAGIIRILREAGESVLGEYAKQVGMPRITSVMAVVHSPWVETRTTRADSKLKRTVRITEKIVEEIAQRAINAGESSKKDELFEHSIIRAELNGYPTSDPIGKVANHVCVTVLESSIHAGLARAIQEISGSLVPGRPLSTRSATLAVASVLRTVATRVSDYTILDMTSEASACSTVRSGDLTHHAVVPVGTRTIVHRIAEKTGALPDEVRARLRMIPEEECTDAVCKQVDETLDSVEPEFLKAFGEVFSKLAEERRMPNTLVLAVPDDLALWAAAFFGRLDFSQFTITGRPFFVQRLSAAALAPYVRQTHTGKADAGLSLAAAFLHMRNRTEFDSHYARI